MFDSKRRELGSILVEMTLLIVIAVDSVRLDMGAPSQTIYYTSGKWAIAHTDLHGRSSNKTLLVDSLAEPIHARRDPPSAVVAKLATGIGDQPHVATVLFGHGYRPDFPGASRTGSHPQQCTHRKSARARDLA